MTDADFMRSSAMNWAWADRALIDEQIREQRSSLRSGQDEVRAGTANRRPSDVLARPERRPHGGHARAR